MKSVSLRSLWLVSLLICGSLLLNSAALAADGDAADAVSPNQVSIAGEVGGDYERTLLVRLGPGVEIEGVVPGDLDSTTGTSVLPADSITASWPTPEPVPTQETGTEPNTGDEVAVDVIEQAAGSTVETEVAGQSRADDSAADPTADAETDTETDVIFPVPLTVAVNLFEVAAGQYNGKIFIVTSEGELPVTLNVSVKDRGIWPMLVLLAGLALGIGMSYYRKRGRRRDELLVEAGALRQSIDADPELVADAAGSGFRQRMDNELLEAQVALRAADWTVAGEKIAAARAVYVTWRKDRSNWIAQLTSAAEMRERIEPIDEPFFRDLLAKLDAAVAETPSQSDAGPLRETLVILARHEAEYQQADQLLVEMKDKFSQLPSTTPEQKEFRRDYADKPADYARDLSRMRPISAAEKYATEYSTLVDNLETDIRAIRDELAKGAKSRGVLEAAMQAAPAAELQVAADQTVPPLEQPIDKEDADEASKRLRYFWIASYAVALILLGLAGYNELYVTKVTFGANPWADYATLFAWGFGAEATRAAVTDVVRGWDIPFGDGGRGMVIGDRARHDGSPFPNPYPQSLPHLLATTLAHTCTGS
jgi:hypothetical protein